MFVERLEVALYRTLEKFEVDFTSSYTALCGRNNAGKSNIIRALRYLMDSDDRYYWEESPRIVPKDRTAWVQHNGCPIVIEATLRLQPEADAGLILFIQRLRGEEVKVESPASLTLSCEIGDEEDVGVFGKFNDDLLDPYCSA